MWADLPQYIKLFAAMIFVLSLMGGLAWLLKRLGLDQTEFGNLPRKNSAKKRLSVIEALPLDARRRLVLIQRDNTQHLVILGPNGETVVETNIKSPKAPAKSGKKKA